MNLSWLGPTIIDTSQLKGLGEHSLGKVELSLGTFGRNGLTQAYLGHRHERSACWTQEIVDVVL